MKHWNIEVDAELVNLADSIDSVIYASKYQWKTYEMFFFTNSRAQKRDLVLLKMLFYYGFKKRKEGIGRRDLVLLKMATIEFPLATSLLSIDKLTT